MDKDLLMVTMLSVVVIMLSVVVSCVMIGWYYVSVLGGDF